MRERSGLLLLGLLANLLLIPVITFYLLLDWDNLVAKIDSLLPRDHAPVIRRVPNDIPLTWAASGR